MCICSKNTSLTCAAFDLRGGLSKPAGIRVSGHRQLCITAADCVAVRVRAENIDAFDLRGPSKFAEIANAGAGSCVCADHAYPTLAVANEYGEVFLHALEALGAHYPDQLRSPAPGELYSGPDYREVVL